MKHLNARPSTLPNLGAEVLGAKRHNFDTYENPEKTLERERVKRTKGTVKTLKADSIAALNETNFLSVVQSYEFAKALAAFPNFQGVRTLEPTSLDTLKAHVLEHRADASFNTLADKFNRLSRLLRRVRYRVKTLDQARKYFEPKAVSRFTEFNGAKRPWKLETAFNAETVQALSTKTRAVQFGNSVPETEREYCLTNLNQAIEILEKRLSFDFQSLAFSFGARGLAGSIAHYQDSQKVLAFNRSWDGAFIHELGHAIDYSLGPNASAPRSVYSMPRSIQDKYRAQLNAHNVDRDKQRYYREPTEIFARLFEVYIRATVPECTEWMQTTFNQAVMPELDAESLAWMSETLKTITKEA